MTDRETPDLASSSDSYARRFAGPVGNWFLSVQARLTLDLLADLPPDARLLDVGGGHAQLLPHLLDAGYRVVVYGSPEANRGRVAPCLSPGRCDYVAGDLTKLPFPDRSFDAALSFRILPHHSRWDRIIGELCRVARSALVVDYPSRRSVNVVSGWLMKWKRGVEGDTRPFRLFSRAEIDAACAAGHFSVTERKPQFALPMVFHRMVGRAGVARALEAPARALGLTRWLGSPVIAKAEPEGNEAQPGGDSRRVARTSSL